MIYEKSRDLIQRIIPDFDLAELQRDLFIIIAQQTARAEELYCAKELQLISEGVLTRNVDLRVEQRENEYIPPPVLNQRAQGEESDDLESDDELM